jgi:hypothetical protein
LLSCSESFSLRHKCARQFYRSGGRRAIQPFEEDAQGYSVALLEVNGDAEAADGIKRAMPWNRLRTMRTA